MLLINHNIFRPHQTISSEYKLRHIYRSRSQRKLTLYHQPARGTGKSIRISVSEILTQHDLRWNMLPILLNNKHPWTSQVENDHQPSVRAGLNTQTHACWASGDSITSLLLKRPHKQREECWSLSSGWRNEGWRDDAHSDGKMCETFQSVRWHSEVKVKTEEQLGK